MSQRSPLYIAEPPLNCVLSSCCRHISQWHCDASVASQTAGSTSSDGGGSPLRRNPIPHIVQVHSQTRTGCYEGDYASSLSARPKRKSSVPSTSAKWRACGISSPGRPSLTRRPTLTSLQPRTCTPPSRFSSLRAPSRGRRSCTRTDRQFLFFSFTSLALPHRLKHPPPRATRRWAQFVQTQRLRIS